MGKDSLLNDNSLYHFDEEVKDKLNTNNEEDEVDPAYAALTTLAQPDLSYLNVEDESPKMSQTNMHGSMTDAPGTGAHTIRMNRAPVFVESTVVIHPAAIIADSLPFDNVMYLSFDNFDGAITECIYPDENQNISDNLHMNNTIPGTVNLQRLVDTIRENTKHKLIRLETLTPTDVRVIQLCHLFYLICAAIFMGLCVYWARTTWSDNLCFIKENLPCDEQYRRVEIANFSIICAFMLYNIFFAFWYCYRVWYQKPERPENFWVLFLLPLMILYNNPLLYLDRVQFVNISSNSTAASALAVCRYLVNAYCISGITFYTLLRFGSFSRRSNLDDPYSLRFYVIRSCVSWAYFLLVFSLTLAAKIEIDVLPLVSAVALIRSGNFPSRVKAIAIIVNVLQISLVLVFFGVYLWCTRKISTQTYRQARLKYLNITFFFRYSFLYFALMTIIVTVCAAMYPNNYTGGFSVKLREAYVLTVPYVSRWPMVLFFSVYITIEGFLAAPAVYRPSKLEKMVIDRARNMRAGVRDVRDVVLPVNLREGIVGRSPRTTSQAHVIPPHETGMTSHDLNPLSTDPLSGEEDFPGPCSSELVYCQRTMTDDDPILWKPPKDPDGNLINDMYHIIMDDVVMTFNLSWLVYLSQDVMKRSLLDNSSSGYTFHQIWHQKDLDIMVLMVKRDDTILISFRGTVSAANWKVNMKMSCIPHQPLQDPPWLCGKWDVPRIGDKIPKVHSGFWEAYSSLRDEIQQQTRLLLQETGLIRRLLITGHSLGGALATLCAFDMRISLEIPENKISLITFGSPRVGNKAFTRRFGAAVFDSLRIINHSDFITNNPKSNGKVRFNHVNRGLLVDPSGNMVLDPLFMDFKLFHGNGVMPHMMEGYQSSINAFIKSTEVPYEPEFWDFSIYDESPAMEAMKQNIEKMQSTPTIERMLSGVAHKSVQWAVRRPHNQSIDMIVQSGNLDIHKRHVALDFSSEEEG